MTNAIVSQPFLVGIVALLSLVPATVQSLRAPASDMGGTRFWLLLGCAFAGSALLSWNELAAGWQAGLAVALWVTIAATLGLFALVVLRTPEAKPIGTLLFPYLLLAGAVGFLTLPEDPAAAARPVDTGTVVHVLLSVAAYALITLSAVAALAALLKERALKTKSRNVFVGGLPPVAVAERVQIELLLAAGFFLSLSVATGIVEQWAVGIVLDHKSLLSVVSLAVVTVLLFAHFRTGLRGRRAARIALGAFLLLSLAFIGVKFVTDILLGRV